MFDKFVLLKSQAYDEMCGGNIGYIKTSIQFFMGSFNR